MAVPGQQDHDGSRLTEALPIAGTKYVDRKAQAETLAATIIAGLQDDYPGIEVLARDRQTIIFVSKPDMESFSVLNRPTDTIEDLIAAIRRKLGTP